MIDPCLRSRCHLLRLEVFLVGRAGVFRSGGVLPRMDIIERVLIWVVVRWSILILGEEETIRFFDAEHLLHVHVLCLSGVLKGSFALGLLQSKLINVLVAKLEHTLLITKS